MSFKALHDELFVLPNAWDVASARLLVAQGFPAIGTTSLGVAAANGLPDGEGLAREPSARLAHALKGVGAYVTVDLEGGFDGIDAFVADLPADGINIEDSRGSALAPPFEQAVQIAQIKQQRPDLFVNARTDTYWLGIDQDETLERLRAYAEAGADGVYVPGLPLDRIEEVTSAIDLPLNVLAGPPLDELRRRGVKRVSTGSLLFRAAYGVAADRATTYRDTGTIDTTAAPYGEINDLST
jgi:2-methylisocitrate lyase-like PEP mutase family enzyme